MAKFIGRQEMVGIAREATRGILVAPTIVVPKMSYELEGKAPKAVFEGEYGNIVGGDDALVAHKYSEGNLQYEVGDNSIALFLYALFGALSSGSFSSVYKHTLSLSNSVQHQSLSVMVNDPIGAAEAPTKTVAYPMAMINDFEMSVALGELVKCNIGFVAKGHRDYTRQTMTATAENKFAHNHLQFRIAADESGLDAASKINLQELTLRIKKNTIRENALGTVQPVDILNRKVEITGTLKLTYEDRTYRDYMLNGTKKAIQIKLQNQGVTIGSTNPTIQLEFPVVHFHDWEKDAPLDDVAMQELQFTALYDVSNSKILGTDTFVVNSTASY